MKREEIKAIFPEATDEQLDKIMNINGADVEKQKSKVTAIEAELKTAKEDTKKLNDEFEALKASNASGEDWKAKFEALQADNVAKEKQAEADRILKEKTEGINKRFEAVVGDKKFNHDAIKADYLKKFSEAIELDENKSKSDEQIFHDLTKNDAHCFENVTVTHLAGGKPQGVGGKQYATKKDIMSIKDSTERQQAIADNISLFQ